MFQLPHSTYKNSEESVLSVTVVLIHLHHKLQTFQGSHSTNYISLCHKSVNILCLQGNGHLDINSLQLSKRMKTEFQKKDIFTFLLQPVVCHCPF